MKQKVFCIGFNKTGTSSLGEALENLNYKVGNRTAGELLLKYWAKRNFNLIIEHSKTADVFLDIPFCLPYTFQILDHAFPNSKFILTVRNSPEEWYGSLIRFHKKIITKGKLPTVKELKKFNYPYKGWFWEAMQLIYGVNEDNPYDKKLQMETYELHNYNVTNYFRNRQNSLLTLNLSNSVSIKQLYDFLGIEYNGSKMPHLNRTL